MTADEFLAELWRDMGVNPECGCDRCSYSVFGATRAITLLIDHLNTEAIAIAELLPAVTS